MTTSSTGRERLLDRLRRLLALAGSDNVHEADAAQRAAERLMWHHGFSREDAEQESQSGYFELPMGATGWNATWRFALVTIAARHCGAEALALVVGPRRKVRIVGERANVEASKILYESLLDILQSLERHVGTEYADEISEFAEWYSVRAVSDSFRRGVVWGLGRALVATSPAPNVEFSSRVPEPTAEDGVVVKAAPRAVNPSDKVREKFDPEVRPNNLDDADAVEMYDLGIRVVGRYVGVAPDGNLKLRLPCRKKVA